MQIARCLFVVDEMVDGGMFTADLAVGAALDLDRAEVHRFGIEGGQAVGEQFTYAKDLFQSLGSLYGAQHTGNGTEHSCL